MLRFPGGSFPKEAMTGDPVLDRYLADLDAKLRGGAKVRLLTLAEVKDNLLERKELARKTTASDAEASQAAVREMGAVELFADGQRAELKQRFVKTMLQFGLPFGLFMGVVNGFTEGHPLSMAIFQGVFCAVFAGPLFAWWMVFAYPNRRLPEKGDSGSEYTVAYSKKMRALGRIEGVFLAAVAFVFIFGRTIPQVDAFVHGIMRLPQWMIVLLGALALFDFFAVRLAWRTYRVDRDGFWIEGRFKKERVVWSNVKAMGTLSERRPWLPAYWKRVKYIEYANLDGRQRRVNLFPDMINADRFLLSIRERLEGARGA